MTAPEPTPTADEHIDAVALDLDAIEAAALANDGWWSVPAFALVAEVRRLAALCIPLTDLAQELDLSRQNLHHSRAMSSAHFERAEREKARAESAEAEVVTLRARLAAVEALTVDWPCSDDTCDGDCTGCAYASDLRAALAVTTGEGEHVAREVFTADGIPFVSCLCTNAKSPTRWLTDWLIRYDPDDGEPYGEICDCEIGDDHDATGEGE